MSKKDLFKRDANLSFISTVNDEVSIPESTVQEPKREQKKKKNNSKSNEFELIKREKKSAKVHLLLKPSILTDLNQIAEELEISRNELINYMLEKSVNEYKGSKGE